MQLPFTATQFVEVFARYNAAIWPGQLVAYALGALAVLLACRRLRYGNLAASLILAAFWAFTGIGYHLLSFTAINPAARLFGIAFVAQALLFAVEGLRGRLRFRVASDARSRAGLALVGWAMVVYPLLGFVQGHGFPNGPVFGLTPCPLAIFTFGMLLLAERPPRYLAIVPMLWAIVGTTAATTLGIREDVSLLVSGLVWVALSIRLHLQERRAAGLAGA